MKHSSPYRFSHLRQPRVYGGSRKGDRLAVEDIGQGMAYVTAHILVSRAVSDSVFRILHETRDTLFQNDGVSHGDVRA